MLNILKPVIKWETRKWVEADIAVFAISAAFILFLFILPTPMDSWHWLLRGAVSLLYITAFAPILCAAYLLVISPIIVTPVICTLSTYNLPERSSGVALGYFMAVRIVLGIISGGIGIVVLALTITASRPVAYMNIIWISDLLARIGAFPINFDLFTLITLWTPAAMFTFIVVSLLKMKWYWHVVKYVSFFFMGLSTGAWLWGRGLATWIISTVVAVIAVAVCSMVSDRYTDTEAQIV